jgi:hypothetical protein
VPISSSLLLKPPLVGAQLLDEIVVRFKLEVVAL